MSFPRGWIMNPYIRMLPHHYLKHRLELKKPPTTRVHDDPNPGTLLDYHVVDEENLRIDRLADNPIRPEKIPISDYGFFAGEGKVKGFKLPKKKLHVLSGGRVADLWVPNVFRTTLYSEILDKYFNVVVTEHALKQIDKCYGLDHYILRTPIQDLQSQLALTLRRKMLIALAENSYHPNDPEKAKIVYETYKDCIIPLEEAKWFGLSWAQAVRKQHDEYNLANQDIPMKVRLGKELLEKLDELKLKGQMDENIGTVESTAISNVWERLKGKFRKPSKGKENSESV